MTRRMEPFRESIKLFTPFIWNTDLGNLFMESKIKITTDIGKGAHNFD